MKELLESLDISSEIKGKLLESFDSALEAIKEETENKLRSEIELKSAKFEAEMAEKIRITEETAEQYISDYKAVIESTLESYMNIIAEEFISENKLQMEDMLESAKAKAIIESVQAGLIALDLTVDEINESKEKISKEVSTQEAKLEESAQEQVKVLKEKIDELVNENISLKRKVEATLKVGLVKESVEGLTDLQKDKVMKLAEEFEYNLDKPSAFVDKLLKVKETIVQESEVKENVDSSKAADTVSKAEVIVESVAKYVPKAKHLF